MTTKMLYILCVFGFKVQVQEAISVSDRTSDAVDTFLGEQCTPLLKEMGDAYVELLAENTDEEIIEYSCNGLQRKQSMKRVKTKEEDLATQHNPCIAALETLIEEADSHRMIDYMLGDKAMCREDVRNLLDDLREGLDSVQFVEVEVGFFFTSIIVAVGSAVVNAAAAGAAIAGAAAATTAGATVGSAAGAVVVATLVPVVPPPP